MNDCNQFSQPTFYVASRVSSNSYLELYICSCRVCGMACMCVRININFPCIHAYHTSSARLVTWTMNSYAEPRILDMSSGVTVACRAIYFNPQQQCRGCSTVVEERRGACQWGRWTVLHSRTDHPGGTCTRTEYNSKVNLNQVTWNWQLIVFWILSTKGVSTFLYKKKVDLCLHMCRLTTYNVNIPRLRSVVPTYFSSSV